LFEETIAVVSSILQVLMTDVAEDLNADSVPNVIAIIEPQNCSLLIYEKAGGKKLEPSSL
jgi:hypothetical protein